MARTALDVWAVSQPYFSAFLRLSDGREYVVGMGGAMPRRITFTEMESYGRVYGFADHAQRLQDFCAVIGRLDDAFMAHAADPHAVDRMPDDEEE